jgi:ribosomal protein L39E
MTKKSAYKKRRLGKKIKQARRMPLLATLRTHRRMQQNRFNRNWRSQKLGMDER